MKKTEHVPSTGRPSSREGEPTSCDRPSPPQELPSNLPPPSSSSPPTPHHSVRDSHIPCTSHLRAPLHHPLTTRPLLNRCPALPRETHTHVHVCSFPYLPPCPFTSLAPRPLPRPLLLFFLLLGDGESTKSSSSISQTFTHTHTRGPSGYPRGR